MNFSGRPKEPASPLEGPPTDPDPLDAHVGAAGVWGLPSDEGLYGQSPAMLVPPRPTGDRYSEGIIVGMPDDADALPSDPLHWVGAVAENARAWEPPREATHRRYEPPITVSINQSAAGYLKIASGRGLHYIKILSAVITLDAVGTFRLVQSDDVGTGVTGTTAQPGDLTGNFNMNPGLVLPPATTVDPWLYTTPDLTLGLFSVTGKAQGFVTYCYAPYDS